MEKVDELQRKLKDLEVKHEEELKDMYGKLEIEKVDALKAKDLDIQNLKETLS